ncbi:MAG TPA: DUF393 domain-containing protein [Candidatus Acidoferrum sp.]|nr:DUF393 domain-containing protein [Candidatus Acidoferrum sp.]
MISVSTETTDAAAKPLRGWVLYDGGCEFCCRSASRMEPILAPRGFVFLPLQTPWVRAFFHLPEDQLLDEMRVLLRNGEAHGGADAIIALARYVWWGWPLVALAHLPGVRAALRAGYRRIAARRYCINGACAVAHETGDRAYNQATRSKS